MRLAAIKAQGFTLIELLVVIAILAILAAFLFPVFAQVREKARQASCLSNLKQIGAAVMMYLEDYDEVYPGGPPRPGERGWNLAVPGPECGWGTMTVSLIYDGGSSGRFTENYAAHSVAVRLLPYLRTPQVFLCPSDPTGERWVRSFWWARWEGIPRVAMISYVWHRGLSDGYRWPGFPNDKTLPGTDPARSVPASPPVSFAEISRPALLGMVWDHSDVHSEDPQEWWRLNICYADGHVRYTRLAKRGLLEVQIAFWWNFYNPRQPLNVEVPCTPTCADEAARGN